MRQDHRYFVMTTFFSRQSVQRTLILLCLCVGIPAQAAELVKILDPWARATVPGQKVGGVYMEIVARENLRLTAIKTAAAESAQVHQMKIENGMMRMRAVPFLQLPAGKPVKLEPGGYHIMLNDLRRSLVSGQELTLELNFEDAANHQHRVPVKVVVRDRDAGTGGGPDSQ
jgi:copper(I)-binding protein